MHTFTVKNKMMFYLKPLLEEEINEARLLCDECVGENLYSKEEIATAIGDPNRFFYLLKSEQGETVGYIYYYLTDEENIARYAKIDVGVLSSIYSNPNKKVGKIQSVGVKAEYRGIGLATQMLRFILGELKKFAVDATFIVCWKPGGIVPLARALADCSFSYLTETQRVWYNETELICPYCKGRCLCGAEIYYKFLCEEYENET